MNRGHERERLICINEQLAQTTQMNMAAVNGYDAVDAMGRGYEIKSFNGSWHIYPQPPVSTERTTENDEIFVQMLQSHKAEYLVAVFQLKKEDFYIIISFKDYIKGFEKYGKRLNFYRVDKDTKTKQLKFRPNFGKKIVETLSREFRLEIKRLA